MNLVLFKSIPVVPGGFFVFLKKPCIYIIPTYLLFQTLGHDLRGAPGHAGFKQGEKQ